MDNDSLIISLIPALPRGSPYILPVVEALIFLVVFFSSHVVATESRNSEYKIMKNNTSTQANRGLELFDAVHYNDLEKIGELLSQGVSVNAKNQRGQTIFQKLIDTSGLGEDGEEREATINYLISQGADIHALGSSGNTLLHKVVGVEMFSTVDYLLSNNIDYDKKCNEGKGAIFHAKSIKMLQLLLAKNVGSLSDVDNEGNTLLHNIVRFEAYKNILTYLSSRIPIDAINNRGNTLLMNVLFFGQQPDEVEYVVDFLLARDSNVNIIGFVGRSALLLALTSGNQNLSVIKKLIESGADIDLIDEGGLSAIHLSAIESFEQLKLLVSYGVDINMSMPSDFGYWTPLQLATLNNRKDSVKYLLDKGADVNVRNRFGKTALNYAKEGGFSDIVAMLIAHQAIATSDNEVRVISEKLKIKQENDERKPKIASLNEAISAKNLEEVKRYFDGEESESNLEELAFLAIAKGDFQVFEYFISEGADFQKNDKHGFSKLHAAVFHNQLDIARYLIDKKVDVNAVSPNGSTIFSFSANSSIPMVELLLNSNIEHRGKSLNVDIVSDSIYYFKPNLAKYFIQQGYVFNLDTLTDEKIITRVIVNSSTITLQFLMEKGLNIEQKVSIYGDDVTLLHLAITLKSDESAMFLIKSGANPNARNSDGAPLFSDAIKYASLDVLNALYDNGGDLNDTTGPFNMSPLHIALELSRIDIVRLLVNKGADTNQKENFHENTPLHMAAKLGYLEVIKQMIKHGAQSELSNKSNETPLDIAKKHGQKEVEKYLLSIGKDRPPKGATIKML